MVWLHGAYGLMWPVQPSHFVGYLEVRAAEPCGKSVPGSLLKTLMFMEIAAEIPVDQRISKHPALVNCMEELVLYLDRRVTTGRKEAPMFLVSVVEALERAVVDMDLPRYVRGYAWYKLFKLWGGMRFNDTQGIEVSSILVADITQSKSTGPGKAVTRISVYVARGAWLVEKHWLQSGFSLWLEMAEKAGLEERDYFLALPTKDLGGIVNRVARYTEAVGMTQASRARNSCTKEQVHFGPSIARGPRLDRGRRWLASTRRSRRSSVGGRHRLTRTMSAPLGPRWSRRSARWRPLSR